MKISIDDIKLRDDPYQLFIDSIRSPETARKYEKALEKFLMAIHLKKDEDEWKFYNDLILEWNAKHWIKKPLSVFLRFILDRVAFSLRFEKYQ